ncbi:MAG: hypothetical protein JSR81_13385 [Proteobacteria bacterium]|nr:hypothetical protein [Pseudomonadota bacterium]
MNLSNLAALGSFVSGLAVLVSLILLWFQLRQMNEQVRQSEKNQRAAIRQAHSARVSEIFMRRADHCELWAKAYRGDPLDDAEIYHVLQSMSAVFFGIEDSFYQYRDGLLDEAAWQANLAGLKQALRSPVVRIAWPVVRPSAVGTDFVALVDKLIAETPPVSSSDVFVQARAALLREMQTARSDVPLVPREPAP